MLANLCIFVLQSTFNLADTMRESPQTSVVHDLLGIQLWICALWFISISHCKTSAMLWAQQAVAESQLAVAELEESRDLLQRQGGGQISFPSLHPIA